MGGVKGLEFKGLGFRGLVLREFHGGNRTTAATNNLKLGPVQEVSGLFRKLYMAFNFEALCLIYENPA